MRFLFYVNLMAVVLLAGALGKIYDGTPLPWLDRPGKTDVHDELRTELGGESEAEPSAASNDLPQPVANPEREADAPTADVSNMPTPRRLTWLTEGAYPPFNYRDASGALTGFDIEIAKALCLRLSAECQFAATPWANLLPSLQAGKADAVVASILKPVAGRTQKQTKGVIFTQSYYATPGHFAARRNDVPSALTQQALANKKIAVQAGSVHRAFLAKRFQGFNILEVRNLEEGEQALAQGKADLLFADRNAMLQWLASDKSAGCCRLVGSDYADPTYFGEGAGIALRADQTALRDELNDALAAIIADGTYAAISSHYFNQSIY